MHKLHKNVTEMKGTQKILDLTQTISSNQP